MARARSSQLLALLCLLAAVALPGQGDASSAAANLAEGRAYSLSPPPNYPGAEDATGGMLTDGRRALRLAPALSNTVAWRRTAPVSVSLDLGGLRPVGGLVLHSFARPSAGLHYPSQVFAYASADGAQFRALGQSALSPDSLSGSTELTFAPVAARHVVLVIYPQGDFLAIDEVQIRGGAQAAAVRGGLLLEEVPGDAAKRRQAAALAAGGRPPRGSAPDQRIAVSEPVEAGEAPQGCAIRRVDPWSGFKAGSLASLPEAATEIFTSGSMGAAHAAWTVSNTSATPVHLAMSGDAAMSAVSFVQAADLSWVGDVPQPAFRLTLPPRTTVVLLARIMPPRGQSTAHVAIDCGTSRFEQDLAVKVISDAEPVLHANLWPYLKGAAGKSSCAASLLPLTGTDTAVIPPSALLAPGGDELKQYFRAFRSARRIYLFLDLKRPEWAMGAFAEPDARQGFAAWWRAIKGAAVEAGAAGEIVLYPFDEIRPEHVPQLHAFKSMFSRISPRTRLFGTIDTVRSAAALRHLDIVQLLDRPELLRLDRGGRETHLYDTRGQAKGLSPYGYYRLQAWRAYAEGLAGIGVWSLWESDGADHPGTGWSLFGGGERDYGVIYAGRDGCPMPSLRLLAWRKGLEDAALLKRCETAIGRERLRLLAQRVAEDPQDTAMADRALAGIAEKCNAAAGGEK